jgi:tetratricopeptide (TPR) repeat protein
MTRWTNFPFAEDYYFNATSLTKNWARLHQCDCEPMPVDQAVMQAWVLFHNGHFEQAAQAGIAAGGDGITVANKSSCIYANYLEPQEKKRFELFRETAARAEVQQAEQPDNANAWFWQAYALGRYSQGISVTKALAQGLGKKVKDALEQTIALSPLHADAHIALAAFHAEVIDKIGPLIGRMTFGAKKDTGLMLFQRALTLNPHSVVALIEYANGLIALDGDQKMQDATRLFEKAASSHPMDAAERLAVELARGQLQE